ncbi:MAG: D-aminoacyl-tRNA deacylase [Gemmataceae bacterium]
MRVVLQRVRLAEVRVGGEIVGAIGPGWLALLGIAPTDTAAITSTLAEKVAYLRAFADDDGKMNRSVLDISGSVLVVSNFTLYAECWQGRRPSFLGAARPEIAEPLYSLFQDELRRRGVPVATGQFGADMQLTLINDGPVTFVVDSAPIGS